MQTQGDVSAKHIHGSCLCHAPNRLFDHCTIPGLSAVYCVVALPSGPGGLPSGRPSPAPPPPPPLESSSFFNSLPPTYFSAPEVVTISNVLLISTLNFGLLAHDLPLLAYKRCTPESGILSHTNPIRLMLHDRRQEQGVTRSV